MLKRSKLLFLASAVAIASTAGHERVQRFSFSTFKVLFLLNAASITLGSASVSPSSKHLLYEISSVSRLVLSISVENRLTVASGPRSLGIRYNDLSVLHLRMALIEGSSALLMCNLLVITI